MRRTGVRRACQAYAEKLNFLLQHLEGHYLRGYGDRSQAAEIVVLAGAVDAAEAFLSHSDVLQRIDRVGTLIEGFETPYGLELLATLHWVMMESMMAALNKDLAVAEFQSWSIRKRKIFKPEHITIAWRHLRERGWVDQDIVSTGDS